MSVAFLAQPISLVRAQADAQPDSASELAHAVTAGAATSNLAPITGVLAYRLRLAPSLQLGVELEGGLQRQGFVAGYAVEGGGLVHGLAFVQGTVLREGPLWLDLRGGLGVRQQLGAEIDPLAEQVAETSLDAATALLVDPGMIANIEAGPWLTLRSGLTIPVALQLAPAVGLDTLGFLTHAGLAVHLNEAVSLTADFGGGGVFGFDGDGGKIYGRGQLGLRWLIGASTRDWRAF